MLLAPSDLCMGVIASGSEAISCPGARNARDCFVAFGLLAMTLPLHHRAGAQIGDRGLVVAEIAQHLLGVLAETGGRAEFRRLGGTAHVDRLPDGLQRAELWMFDRPRH